MRILSKIFAHFGARRGAFQRVTVPFVPEISLGSQEEKKKKRKKEGRKMERKKMKERKRARKKNKKLKAIQNCSFRVLFCYIPSMSWQNFFSMLSMVSES